MIHTLYSDLTLVPVPVSQVLCYFYLLYAYYIARRNPHSIIQMAVDGILIKHFKGSNHSNILSLYVWGFMLNHIFKYQHQLL